MGDKLISAVNSSSRTNRRRAQKRAARARRSAGSKKSAQPVTCEQEVDFIARYLASDLNGRELAAFENHLELCPDCVAFLQTYKTTVDLTRNFLANQAHASQPLALSFKPLHSQKSRR
jgi:hypothetical protein